MFLKNSDIKRTVSGTCFTFLLLFFSNLISSQTIKTYAGNGFPGYNGENIPATNAQLFNPYGVSCDPNGNIFIAEVNNQRIRKVNLSNLITTVAGNGNGGYSGDGGLAINAEIANARGVDAGTNGNFFIADYSNNVIRMVDQFGIITTFAGDGSLGSGGDGGLAINAQLNGPYAAVTDANGNTYIAEMGGSRIRMVNPQGIISTIAGTVNAGYNGDGIPASTAWLLAPSALAIDNVGNLYIADYGNDRIRKINQAGIISTVAGNGISGFSGDGGPATSAKLYRPRGVAVDAVGNIYICDRLNQRIRRVDPSGIISTLAGNGLTGFGGDGGNSTNAVLSNPTKITVDQYGDVYFCDNANHRIRKISCITPPNIGVIATPSTGCIGNTLVLNGTGGVTYTWSGGIQNDVPFTTYSTSVYTVTGTAVNGCTNVAVITVSVFSNPTVSINSTTNSICSGSSLTLNGAGAVSYSWNNGILDGNSFIPIISNTYIVTGTDNNNCSDTASVFIEVKPLPKLELETGSKSICSLPVQQTTTLTCSGAVNYTWIPGSISGSSISVSPTITTIYTIIAFGTNQCVNSSTILLNVSNCTSENEVIIDEKEFYVFPNPSDGEINFNCQYCKFNIIDILGNEIYSDLNDFAFSGKIKLSLNEGVYFLIGDENGYPIKVKILVKR